MRLLHHTDIIIRRCQLPQTPGQKRKKQRVRLGNERKINRNTSRTERAERETKELHLNSELNEITNEPKIPKVTIPPQKRKKFLCGGKINGFYRFYEATQHSDGLL